MEKVCYNSDLVMTCGFMRPGIQTVRILDAVKNKLGVLEVVCYSKEVNIEPMTKSITDYSPALEA